MGHFLFHPQNKEIRIVAGALCFAVILCKHRPNIQFMLLLCILFIIQFFRDPIRSASFPNQISSPAYGRVTNIIHSQGSQIVSIFLSVFDPHAQYAPCDGTIRDIEYIPGTFHAAQLYEKTKDNERCVTTLQTTDGDTIRITQIAGFIARRILRFYKTGDNLCQGQPFGMIRFGSRVDIELPNRYRILVKEGSYVNGPNTLLAVRH